MPSGGYRPNAGRPVGVKDSRPRKIKPKAATGPVTGLRQMPLQFLLQLMNDESAPIADRLRAAAVAAPFVHGKPAPVGKKLQADYDALHCHEGTAWADLLLDSVREPAAPAASQKSDNELEWERLLGPERWNGIGEVEC